MKKPLLYPKLAWQGIRKNAETYLPYLLMGILMVGVSYIMNYLTRPALMGALSMGGTTLMVLQMGKIVISVFSVIFLYYCNSFLIRRRMKEFGLYNILGMGKGNIARVMLWETLLTALLVFAGGLLLGLSLSRLVEMALINLLHADYTVPMELFYPDGVTWVLLLFGGIYVLILLANLWRMRLTNPVALLKSESVGEKPPKGNWFFALAGLVILLGAYYLAAVSQSPMEALMFFFVAVLMVIIATYLLFVSGSVTLCRMLRRSKRYYYQTRHFISVSAMAYRMKRNGAGMATICILCTMVLVILTSTVCLSAGTDSMVDAICPQDINLTIGLEARDGEENRERLDAMRQMALTVTEEMGYTVVHDTTAFEPPKLADAYARSLTMLEQRTASGETYDLYIDLHRDAISSTSTIRRTVNIGGEDAARFMVLVGKGTTGGYHEMPDFAANLHIAELLTDKLEAQCEGLSRDVKVRTGRFNQHIAPRCVLIECGTNENTLEEVLCGIPYLAQAIAETLDALEAETMSNEE